jgi:DNA-binding CsgD family transcriptional regulator
LDIAPGSMSCRPVDATTLSSITIHRKMARPFFSERDARLAHILLSEIPWLHPRGVRECDVGSVPSLSPRKRSILLLLVAGQSRRDISQNLGLSEHTINDYVKEIFGIFGVNSQAQLVARFLSGDGGDGLE